MMLPAAAEDSDAACRLTPPALFSPLPLYSDSPEALLSSVLLLRMSAPAAAAGRSASSRSRSRSRSRSPSPPSPASKYTDIYCFYCAKRFLLRDRFVVCDVCNGFTSCVRCWTRTEWSKGSLREHQAELLKRWPHRWPHLQSHDFTMEHARCDRDPIDFSETDWSEYAAAYGWTEPTVGATTARRQAPRSLLGPQARKL